MKHADLTTGSGKLHHAYRALRAHWEQTQQDWHDPVSRKFEEEYLAQLEPHVTAVMERLSSLAQVIHAAEEACS